MDEPMLGLATTAELIAELRARVEVGRVGLAKEDTMECLGWLRGFEGRLTPEELAYSTCGSIVWVAEEHVPDDDAH